MPISPARLAAFEVLLAVERDSFAFADDLLHSERFQTFDERDLALATEITFGVIRRRGEIDRLIESASSRRSAAFDPEVLIALRIGAYQIAHLDRIPKRAAVSDSVDLVKKFGKTSAAGLVNAVLRKLPAAPPDPQAAIESTPAWLQRRWSEQHGAAAIPKILAAALLPPETYLRFSAQVDPLSINRELADSGVQVEPAGAPGAYRVLQGRPTRSPALAKGLVRIQDIGSQSIVPLLDLEPGQVLLDVCSAPGGKALQAAEAVSPGFVVAGDRSRLRLSAMAFPAGVTIHRLQLNAEQPLPFSKKFDRILVDVPCSGTGTLARNPEIKWRLRLEDLPDFHLRQVKILNRSLDVLSAAGLLVYSTCSIEREENQEVVEEVLAERTEFTADPYLERIPGVHPGDGFFAARIRRR